MHRKHCHKCGKRVHHTHKHCPHCGAKLLHVTVSGRSVPGIKGVGGRRMWGL